MISQNPNQPQSCTTVSAVALAETAARMTTIMHLEAGHKATDKAQVAAISNNSQVCTVQLADA
jgi:hypothetical protein